MKEKIEHAQKAILFYLNEFKRILPESEAVNLFKILHIRTFIAQYNYIFRYRYFVNNIIREDGLPYVNTRYAKRPIYYNDKANSLLRFTPLLLSQLDDYLSYAFSELYNYRYPKSDRYINEIENFGRLMAIALRLYDKRSYRKLRKLELFKIEDPNNLPRLYKTIRNSDNINPGIELYFYRIDEYSQPRIEVIFEFSRESVF